MQMQYIVVLTFYDTQNSNSSKIKQLQINNNFKTDKVKQNLKINTSIIMSLFTAASATSHSLRRSVQAQNEEPYTHYCQSDEGTSTTCSDNMLVPEYW